MQNWKSRTISGKGWGPAAVPMQYTASLYSLA